MTLPYHEVVMVKDVRTSLSPDACRATCISCTHRLCEFLRSSDLAKEQTFRELRRGDQLPLEEGGCQRIWIVLTGTVGVCMTLANGRRQIVSLETRDGIICGALNPAANGRRVEALEQSRICEIKLPDECFQGSGHPALTMKLLHLLHEQLERATIHNIALGRLDSSERVSWFLAQMARRIGVVQNGSVRVSLPLSREDIADYVGLNAETVSRLLGRVKKRGDIIFLSPTEYVIPDFAAFERRAAYNPFIVPFGADKVQQTLMDAS